MDRPTGLEVARQHLEGAWPFIPMYIHLIVSALFPIYTGAYASLSRPSSAAKPSKKDKKTGPSEDDEDEDEDEDVQKMEGLSPQDAIVFPVTAGIVLAGLYFLIKRYGADIVNVVLGIYFAGVGTYSVGKLVNDAVDQSIGLIFPKYFAKDGKLWKVHGEQRKAVARDVSSETSAAVKGVDPPEISLNNVWKLRTMFMEKFTTKLYIHETVDLKANLTRINAISAVVGICSVAYAAFIDKPWWLTNLQGFAVCYGAMQLMSPTSFTTGSLILMGLFCYDVWAVFFTPLMVTVAKNLDVPIKLVFPRPDEGYSMLGLGDIVLPGIMIGLALRFDLYMFYLRKQKKQQVDKANDAKSGEVQKAPYVPVTGNFGDRLWTRSLPATAKPEKLSITFPKPYFIASMIGYVIGMLTTLGIMSVFQHAQPALLYLVPGVLLSLWGTGLVRGEFKHMWDFSEAINGEQLDEEDERKGSTDADKQDEKKDERSWLQYFKDEIFGVVETKEAGDKRSKEDNKKSEDNKSNNYAIVSFSISRFRAPKINKSAENKNASDEQSSATPSDGSLEDTVLVGDDDQESLH